MFQGNCNIIAGFLALCLEIGVAAASTGQAPDPASSGESRWMIPTEDPCQCTEVQLGGLNILPCLQPFRVKYWNTLLRSRDSEEIQTWMKCEVCRDPLGMENSDIPDNALSASNVGHTGYGIERSRLNFKAAWCPRSIDENQWIRIDLQAPTTVAGLITQGRHHSDVWVTSYAVQYSDDGINWNNVTGSDGTTAQFQANTDNETPVTNIFPASLTTRFIQIRPLAWARYICLRLELLGCRSV
ncbi:retinoschisin-like isoform X2 [Acanthaster planci]|uniref:Retinoschisin-like isoform X2 n=1 Tax=Acanthaster planci TaxID=133434 RepID=A0A8B7YM91_ACAPL|nr:retinoschisin-like isoform X2 [Acanthaster planci]